MYLSSSLLISSESFRKGKRRTKEREKKWKCFLGCKCGRRKEVREGREAKKLDGEWKRTNNRENTDDGDEEEDVFLEKKKIEWKELIGERRERERGKDQQMERQRMENKMSSLSPFFEFSFRNFRPSPSLHVCLIVEATSESDQMEEGNE